MSKIYSMCKTRLAAPAGQKFQAVGISGQIFSEKTKKFVTYFTSIPEGYLESMDVQVCAEARSFEVVKEKAREVGEEEGAQGAEVSTICLEKITWKKVMEVVIADVDESFSLSEQTRKRMKEKAKFRFGQVLWDCLTE